jgi:hypothetical protein
LGHNNTGVHNYISSYAAFDPFTGDAAFFYAALYVLLGGMVAGNYVLLVFDPAYYRHNTLNKSHLLPLFFPAHTLF